MSEARYEKKLINLNGKKRLIRFKNVGILERRAIILDIQFQVAEGELSLGKAIRRLRKETMGLSQDVFAGICKMSTRTLASIESEIGNPSMCSIASVFRKFGIRLSLEMTGSMANEEQLVKRIGRLGLQVKAADQEATQDS
ncbi:helix-turn-helix domain-containing protein [Pseudomonas aeruginosa]|uniref:helix-turn-helix domain-containing protein n=1 Tax=Pseudomonas aeruginosa TaxID=287 RepID=UPI001F4A2097|nr:helix-turn-helix domain-containing protein [Pseudomonas aeruginosa]MCS8153517.1 helix-turn-helix domain-containing protein [Pseudomonas aeruginosa]